MIIKKTKITKDGAHKYKNTLNMRFDDMRFDDECGNGHNDFAMTVDVYRRPITGGRWTEDSFGCQHELVTELWPEYAHLVKWHLCNTDGPMRYIANTCYLAGNRDCHGRAKGEVSSYDKVIRFSVNPICHRVKSSFWDYLKEIGSGFNFSIDRVNHVEKDIGVTGYKFGPKYTFRGYCTEWYKCPFETRNEAENFLEALQTCQPEFLKVPADFSEGKDRELDKARSAAIWPEATDEELCQSREDLTKALEARLPALLDEFRRDLEGAGFTWTTEPIRGRS